MKKIKLIFTTIVCIAMIVVNIISNSQGKIFSVSLSNIELIATANAESGCISGFELKWNGHCWLCENCSNICCEISDQCCDNQPPYC
jgi:hypothetical protein